MRKILTFILLSQLILSGQPLQAQYADCITAREVCDKSAVHISKPKGEGRNKLEADFIHCFMNGDNNGQAEENSTWIKFEIKESGTFSFVITPDDPSDDIDFVVYRLPPNGNCDRKEIVRCMASGASSAESKSPCMGPTGLLAGETDTSEDAGCTDVGDNTWLAPLKTVKGEHYVILVSNVTAPRGWTIRFGGSAKLPCEKPPVKKDPPVKKNKEPKPKPTPPPPPVVQAPPPPPKEINGRTVEVGETVKIYNHRIRVKLWDSQVEDGDVVSLFIGDKKVLDHHLLRAKPEEFVFDLPAGTKEHYLTIYADDFGKSEPNTASVIINDGVSEQRIDLVAGRKKQESVKIVLE